MVRQSRSTVENSILLFSDLRQSIPRLPSGSRTEKQPYMLGIQALETVRPSVTVAEIELFLTGWFLADQWYDRMSDTKGETGVPSSVGHSMPLLAVPQSTKRGLSNSLPSRE
jgi:hypothetical protein